MDQGQRVQALNLALKRVRHVWITVLILGLLGTPLFLWIGFDTREWATVLLYIASIVASIGLGWLVWRRHSQVAAGILLINAVASPVIRFVSAGRISNVVAAGVLAYVCFRGLQATMVLAEMRKESQSSAV